MSEKPRCSVDAKVEAGNGSPLAMLAFGVMSMAGSDADGHKLSPGMDDVSMAMMTLVLRQFFDSDICLGVDHCADGSGDFVVLSYLNGLLRCSIVVSAGVIHFKAEGVASATNIGTTVHSRIAESMAPTLVLARRAIDTDTDPNTMSVSAKFEVSFTEAVRRRLFFTGTGVIAYDSGVTEAVRFEAQEIDMANVNEYSPAQVEVTELFGTEAEEVLRKYNDGSSTTWGTKEGMA